MKINFKKYIRNKLNYFDLAFIIIFLIVVGGIYFFFNRKNEFVNIRVRVTDQDVLYASTNPKTWYANRFSVGDTETNEIGSVVSKITKVSTFNISDDSQVVYLDINIKAVFDKRSKLYTTRGSNLVYGNTLKFNFSKVAFYALITDTPSTFNQPDYSEKNTIVVATERGVGIEPQILNKIKKGDMIKDSNGKILAEVINVRIFPALRITQTSSGQLLQQLDPFYKDAEISLNILTKIYKNDQFVFDIVPLKLGSRLPLNFEYETILPTITEINKQY